MADPTRRVTECTISGCTLPPPMVRGLCSKHYARWKRHGDPTTALRPWRDDKPINKVNRGRWNARNNHRSRDTCELVDHGYCSPQIVVHHVNEDPTDNRAENLRVLCARHHNLHHKGNFDLNAPDHSAYYITSRGTLRRRRVA